MFGWFHDFADPEIAGIEGVPGPSLEQLLTFVGMVPGSGAPPLR
jgi:hypothetical protein